MYFLQNDALVSNYNACRIQLRAISMTHVASRRSAPCRTQLCSRLSRARSLASTHAYLRLLPLEARVQLPPNPTTSLDGGAAAAHSRSTHAFVVVRNRLFQ